MARGWFKNTANFQFEYMPKNPDALKPFLVNTDFSIYNMQDQIQFIPFKEVIYVREEGERVIGVFFRVVHFDAEMLTEVVKEIPRYQHLDFEFSKLDVATSARLSLSDPDTLPDFAIVIPEDDPSMSNFYEALFYWQLMNPGEKWKAYYSHLYEFPSDDELDVLKGIVVTGSF